jgi:AAA15 family ATPase/GTPase
MITEIQIENFKSIQTLKMNLGRVNVFVGENGCGKSNILEAIALASAAGPRLDNEVLTPRGIRVVEPQFMRSAFDEENLTEPIKISLKEGKDFECSIELNHDNKPYSSWSSKVSTNRDEDLFDLNLTEDLRKAIEKDSFFLLSDELKVYLADILESGEGVPSETVKVFQDHLKFLKLLPTRMILKGFLIYSPENTSLRKLDEEGQIEPLGIKGEGLFKLLKVISANKNPDQINEIKEKIRLLDWFDGFEIPQGLYESERRIQIKDRYLDENLSFFDQRSSNEGFLFLLFYFTLFISDYTPKFFAIDNIDASLNPKLCTKLIKELVKLAYEHDKQVIFTTHNPAILDGLNLDDDNQRLFVIHRNALGHTKAKRILKSQPLEGQKTIKMSESFMRGYIGGLPEGF